MMVQPFIREVSVETILERRAAGRAASARRSSEKSGTG
jgi:hypothetical protein